MLPQPRYLPVLAPSDDSLFLNMKNGSAKINLALTMSLFMKRRLILKVWNKGILLGEIQKLLKRWNKCMKPKGYVK